MRRNRRANVTVHPTACDYRKSGFAPRRVEKSHGQLASLDQIGQHECLHLLAGAVGGLGEYGGRRQIGNTPWIRITKMQQLQLGACAFHRVLKLARAIADLTGSDDIAPAYLAEAIQYRPRRQE